MFSSCNSAWACLFALYKHADTVYALKWHTALNTLRGSVLLFCHSEEKTWSPQTVRQELERRRGGNEDQPWSQVPELSGRDESQSANGALDFLAVGSVQACWESADTNCLADLHLMFTCPATVGARGLGFERKHARTFIKPLPKFHYRVDRVKEEH